VSLAILGTVFEVNNQVAPYPSIRLALKRNLGICNGILPNYSSLAITVLKKDIF